MARRLIKINTNSNTVPIKSRPTWSWADHAWNSREGTGPYGQPTFDNNKKVDNIKVNTNPNKKSAPQIERENKIKSKAGKTRIGNLARVRAGLGGIFGKHQR